MILADTALRYDEQRLLEVSAAYRAAEREFNESCQAIVAYNRAGNFDRRYAVQPDGVVARINAMDMDPARKSLESVRDRCLRERNRLLAERAELMKTLRLIR
jgi:hypothetical protein